jgi:hypothetical protein
MALQTGDELLELGHGGLYLGPQAFLPVLVFLALKTHTGKNARATKTHL